MKMNTKSDEIMVDVSDEVEIIKIDSATKVIVPLPCSFCNSNITTTHICRHPCGNKCVEGEEHKLICGLATCVLCMEKRNDENTTRCEKHCTYIAEEWRPPL